MRADAVLVALLAAGRATRFGGGKLDAICAGKPVGQWVLEAVAGAGLSPGVVVTGPKPPRFMSEVKDWDWLINPRPADGLGSSVATAARMARQRGYEALLLVLADMPLVTSDMLKRLVAQTGPAASDHGEGRPGVPALFPAPLFERVAACSGDRGAAVLMKDLPDLAMLPADDGALIDVDTQKDLEQAEALLLRSSPC